jgi:purine-nucleoside phosphorylase
VNYAAFCGIVNDGGRMDRDVEIVTPVVSRHTPRLGPLVVMASSRVDLDDLGRRFGRQPPDARRLFTSRLYPGSDRGPSLVGPFIGAPYAVMLLETLAAWGAETFLFLGWCGAISPSVAVGDLILPTAALVDEGTSRHYGIDIGRQAVAPPELVAKIRGVYAEAGIAVREGTVWSTDAIYRETREKVAHYQRIGVLAVEMEFSALVAAARFRRVDAAGVLVVSDELGGFAWRPGFKDERFKKARESAAWGLEQLCRIL